MALLLRTTRLLLATAGIAVGLTLADPSPPAAQANPVCDAGGGAVETITGGVGIGNPVGDACEELSGAVVGAVVGEALAPLGDAAQAIGQGIFRQVAGWASDGAVWLLGEVATLTAETTTPNLLGKGFVRQYRQMAVIAALMAALMVVLAVLESLARGEPALVVRVLGVHLPLAALATSAAYVVVQLMIGVTDGLCEAISSSTAADTRTFFKEATEALGQAGAALPDAAQGASADGAGAVAVPLFVGFIVAVLAACAAFFVWIELLMRDAAIYVVALFMPFALAAPIWPRWAGALRRTCELTIAIVFSKFVIVAIIALGASLMASGKGVEPVLAAAAMLLLACFAPFPLLRLVSFGEGALSAAYGRQHAASVASRHLSTGTSAQMMRRVAHVNWGQGSGGAGGERSMTSSAPKPARDRGGATTGGAGSPSPGGGRAAAAGGAAGVAASGVATVAGRAAAKVQGGGAAAQVSGSAPSQAAAETKTPTRPPADTGAPAQPKPSPPPGDASRARSPRPGGAPAADPSPPRGGSAPSAGEKPPRPTGDLPPRPKGSR